MPRMMMVKGAGAAFSKGDKVEVTSDEQGYVGAWFEATVVAARGKKRRIVEYDAFVDDEDHSKPLREVVQVDHLRPRHPPPYFERQLVAGDQVEACVKCGWWPGTVVGVVDHSRFLVLFPDCKVSEEVHLSQLRLRKIWIPSRWVSPPEPLLQGKERGPMGSAGALIEKTPKCPSVPRNAPIRFCVGDKVEVSTDEDGFIGAWFAGTIVEPSTEYEYTVEYTSLRSDDDSEPLKEVISLKHIRPNPPDTFPGDRYLLLEEVDTFYKDGWWVGIVSKVLKNGWYAVYFRQTREEMEFNHSDMRFHLDWCDGKWLQASKVLML